MEEVEAANKAAVDSFHKIISLLSQPQSHDPFHHKTLIELTSDVVFGFKRVVSLLDNDLSHLRVRKFKRFKTIIPENILLEKDHQTLPKHIREIGSNVVKNSMQIPQNNPVSFSNYQFLQHQQKYQIKEMMYRRNDGGFNLNFDSSNCTPSISSNKSFVSSLSIEGSVSNLSGNSLSLIGSSRFNDQDSYQHKKRCSVRGDDGSGKCGSSGRCHCSKKRLIL